MCNFHSHKLLEIELLALFMHNKRIVARHNKRIIDTHNKREEPPWRPHPKNWLMP